MGKDTFPISSIINASEPIYRYKAPRGKMFILEGLFFASHANDTNTIVTAQAFWLEDVDVVTNYDEIFFAKTIEGNGYVNLHGIECKFITIAPDSAVTGSMGLIIYANLKKASKIELLWQWFSKRR